MKPLSRMLCLMAMPLLLAAGIQEVSAESVLFKPEKLNFTSVKMDSCRPKLMCAVNIGQAPIENPDFKLEGSDVFKFQAHFRNCPDPLQPGEQCEVYINFCPSQAILYDAILTFTGSSQVVQVKGSGFTAKF